MHCPGKMSYLLSISSMDHSRTETSHFRFLDQLQAFLQIDIRIRLYYFLDIIQTIILSSKNERIIGLRYKLKHNITHTKTVLFHTDVWSGFVWWLLLLCAKSRLAFLVKTLWRRKTSFPSQHLCSSISCLWMTFPGSILPLSNSFRDLLFPPYRSFFKVELITLVTEAGPSGIIAVVDKVILEKWCSEACLGPFYINLPAVSS